MWLRGIRCASHEAANPGRSVLAASSGPDEDLRLASRTHFRPARTGSGWRTAVQGDGKGFPDLLLVRRSTKSKLVAELKVPPNECTTEQREWLADCEAVGIPALLWTPADWDEIEDVLEHGPFERASNDEKQTYRTRHV